MYALAEVPKTKPIQTQFKPNFRLFGIDHLQCRIHNERQIQGTRTLW